MSNRFGTFLRSYRMGIGYGLREFAKDMGMSPSTLSAVEMGHRLCPKSFDWNHAAKLLGIKDDTPDAKLFFAFRCASGLDENLVAALPDLIDALNECIGWFVDNEIDCIALDEAREALKKALGEK